MSCCLVILSNRLMPGSPRFSRFFQFGAGTHVLIAGPMKLDAGLAQQFLNIEPSSSSMNLESMPMDFRKPLVAPLRAAFLNPPLFLLLED